MPIICLTIFIVIGLNAAIFGILRNRDKTVSQIHLFTKAAGSFRQPWEKENAALKELSKKVAELKNNGNNERLDTS